MISTTSAADDPARASTLARSAGCNARPTRASDISTRVDDTPAGADTDPTNSVVDSNGLNKLRIGRSGVNRHSSSRPVGTPKASGSVEVNRSGGVPVRSWECASYENRTAARRGGIDSVGGRHTQPTAPSICSSIRRFSSSAYSIGSSRAIGSTNPRTTMAIASSSLRPRLIR